MLMPFRSKRSTQFVCVWFFVKKVFLSIWLLHYMGKRNESSERTNNSVNRQARRKYMQMYGIQMYVWECGVYMCSRDPLQCFIMCKNWSRLRYVRASPNIHTQFLYVAYPSFVYALNDESQHTHTQHQTTRTRERNKRLFEVNKMGFFFVCCRSGSLSRCPTNKPVISTYKSKAV